ncbi:Nucleotide-binding universal stress protein, UspA family [Saccharopolyspora kobensis]|uniref:Nucleotide-binding universal stress protein, UspA family n=1 Tax=Saccharopolyspora kobensis TaxID=146035 RepID=A0A1H5V4U8_9PSEU|nr:universal stress protein [Saccharopolyspora kobensis]SEF82319.1 Nucleotide-binding universal stress protein, UspA family [Saccharopolyspora kobensis]SFC65245.1 Nucleotide-binding universal stress protein, UspA family [Saccharopolyspora kobensis]
MTENEPRIVVGVDGSPGSRDALRWALNYAGHCGGTLTALIAWTPPTLVEAAPMPPVISDEDSKRHAEQQLRQTVDETTATLATSVPVHHEVVRGPAARSLLDHAQHADLLVVGSRGHGGFAGALLGSVSLHCVSHAHCPVVVVRPGAT